MATVETRKKGVGKFIMEDCGENKPYIYAKNSWEGSQVVRIFWAVNFTQNGVGETQTSVW